MTPAQVARQRDRLLEALRRLTAMGNLGWCPGAIYVEIHVDEIKRAEGIVKRATAAIAKSAGTAR